MIWLNREIKISNHPQEYTLTLVGKYNSPNDTDQFDSIITIDLIVNNNDDDVWEFRMHEHNPSSMVHEEPTKEQVYGKYAATVIKLMKNISNWNNDILLAKINSSS
jgi:hypothetical protein